ncbi:MAG: hypothetical protein IV093_16385 [Rubrivivax sp.]|nr:hypothetical protein [Rubrivivax sp.]
MSEAHLRHAALTAVLLAIALWWLAAPYAGIQHDALYYAADALRRADGAALQGDLFFHRHSQGDFSIFGPVYAWLIDTLGLDTAALSLSLAGRVAWLAALAALCRALAPETPSRWWWLLALALCLPRTYGPLYLLHTAEPFATPRVWAEAAVLGALALWLLQHRLAGGLLTLTAAALHPLMALPGLAMMVLVAAPRVRWSVALLLCVAAAVGWWWQIEPLPRLFQRYDDDWWAVVRGRNPMILFQSWTLGQAAHAMLAGLLLADTVRLSRVGSPWHRLAIALLVVSAASLVLWAGATAYRNVLILQIQPWRVLWLLHLLAPLMWLAAACCRTGRPSTHVLALLALAWLAPSWAAVLVGAVALWLHARPSLWVEHRAVRLGVQFGIAALGLIALLHSAGPLVTLGVAGFTGVRPALQVAAAAGEQVFIAAVLGAAWTLQRSAPRLQWVLPALAATACVGALGLWSSWLWMARTDATDRRLAVEMRTVIPADATVWSELDVANTWLHLRRANYASQSQGAGAQFDRHAAVTLRQRLELLQGAQLTDESWERTPLVRAQVRRPDLPTLRRVCEDGALDWLVFRGSLDHAHVLIHSDDGLATASLVACATLRRDMAQTQPAIRTTNHLPSP